MSSQMLINLKPYVEDTSIKSVQLQKKKEQVRENNPSHTIFTYLFQVTINIDLLQLNIQLESELNKGMCERQKNPEWHWKG